MNVLLQNYLRRNDNNVSNNGSELNQSGSDYQKTGEIFSDLLAMGYSIESLSCCYNKYKFTSVNDAICLMSKDPETNLYNHYFISKQVQRITSDKKENQNGLIIFETEEDKCIICNDKRDLHIVESKKEEIKSNRSKKKSMIQKDVFINKNEISNTYRSGNNNSKDILEKNIGSNDSQKEAKIKVNIRYIEELEKSFNDKENLCFICCANTLDGKNSFKFHCNHEFCNSCISTYLIDKIIDGKTELKCLMAGCPYIIEDQIIQNFVPEEVYYKYLKFLERKRYEDKINQGYIPCVFPDCEEWIKFDINSEPFVECANGHKFCALCKEPPHPNRLCRYRELRNAVRVNSKVKLCPKCHNFIERQGNNNVVTCTFCNYKFCWICLKGYSRYHYFFFNIKGCPGMFSSDPETSALLNNNILTVLCFFGSFIFFLILSILAIILYMFFGAIYELFVWYFSREEKKKEKNKKENGDNNSLSLFSSYSKDKKDLAFPRNSSRRNINQGTNNNNRNGGIAENNNSAIQSRSEVVIISGSNKSINQNEKNIKKERLKKALIYIGLIILGIILQPLLIFYKFMKAVSYMCERFGCFFICLSFLRFR